MEEQSVKDIADAINSWAASGMAWQKGVYNWRKEIKEDITDKLNAEMKRKVWDFIVKEFEEHGGEDEDGWTKSDLAELSDLLEIGNFKITVKVILIT